MSYKNIIGRLKAYEERICEDEEPHEDQTKLMYTSNEAQTGQNNKDYRREYNKDYRNIGRGGRSFYRGRDRGRNTWTRDATNITCYHCDKLGHYATECHDRL